MQQKSFGRYLVEQGLITDEAYQQALQIQKRNRLLAEIAVEMNFLNSDDIGRINDMTERNPAMKFGEAAVSLGLLNSNQLRYLLDIRTRRKTRIGDILIEQGVIDSDTLHKALMNFEQKNGYLEKILLAEPTLIISKIIESALIKHGYKVFKARSGAEALALARTAAPDIVITGGQLSDMEGHELCTRLLSDDNTAIMVILSSDDSPEHLQRAFDSGVHHFLKKPITEQELINLLSQIENDITEQRNESILVVDDSRGARMIIGNELRRAGFNVHMAENGRDGIAAAKKIRPDIITMDIEMPDLDGFTACRLLKDDAETKDIPVVIVSSKSSAELIAQGFDAGAVEYFTKPFTPGSLALYIDLILESRKIDRMGTILAAEDSRTTQHIIKYLFSKNGYTVLMANNGEEALQVLKKHRPDLIVTDCYMPVMDGFAFTTAVRRQAEMREIPIIMLTSADRKDDMLKGLACGANDYIIKPFDESELLARVNTHLLNKRLFDELHYERQLLEQTNRELTGILKELQLLSNMDTSLQSCSSLEETYGTITEFLKRLYPASTGLLLIHETGAADYGIAASWGDQNNLLCHTISPDTCTALMKGAEYVHEKNDPLKACSNPEIGPCSSCICIPLHEQGGIIGLLHIEENEPRLSHNKMNEIAAAAGDPWHILRTAAEHIRLALCNLRLQESLREQSTRDHLTGLYNRRYLSEYLEREIARCQRKSCQMGMIMLDIDFFKQFNDRYGHTAGDALLKEIGATLNTIMRKTDITCRYGGEEFIIVMPEADRDQILKKAEKIRTTIEKNVVLIVGGKNCRPVTVSLGVSTLPHNGQTSQELINAADTALYKAKNNGRNRTELAE